MMRKKPMLAHRVGGFERITDEEWHDGLYIQPKLDGVRCLIQAEGLTPYHDSDPVSHGFVVKAYSRTGKEWKNIDHILDELHPFFAKNRNVILDGELYNHDLKNDFEKIISLGYCSKNDYKFSVRRSLIFHYLPVREYAVTLPASYWIKHLTPSNFG